MADPILVAKRDASEFFLLPQMANRHGVITGATGTGKTFTVFQLCWKLLEGSVLDRKHILFLTDRNSLKNQAYNAFSAFSANERVIVDKDSVAQGRHRVGKVFLVWQGHEAQPGYDRQNREGVRPVRSTPS